MIVFEARNSYELLVSFLFGKYLMACDREQVAILALNLDARLNCSAIENCGMVIESITAPRGKLGLRVLTTLLRRHGLISRLIKRAFLFHEISPLLIGRLLGVEINIVEHGEINYRNIKDAYAKSTPLHPYPIVKRLFGQSFVGEGQLFSHVYLKDPSASPASLHKKVLPLQLETYYDAMTATDKSALLLLFSCTSLEISSTTAACTLVTQPFSELGMMTEARKIEMYQSILTAADCELFIKPHPRETTDYALAFPRATILDQKAPFELLWLAGLRNTMIYTVNSSIGRIPGMHVVTLGDSFLDEFKN
jgi:hypothetical protein